MKILRYNRKDIEEPLSQAEIQVLGVKRGYQQYWQNKDDNYWLQRLIQEIGELSSSLAGDHKDSKDHELIQISSIALNWLERLKFLECDHRWGDPEYKTTRTLYEGHDTDVGNLKIEICDRCKTLLYYINNEFAFGWKSKNDIHNRAD